MNNMNGNIKSGYPYADDLIQDGQIDTIPDNWSVKKDVYFYLADHVFDYLWNIKKDGSVELVDRGYSDGINDRTVQTREKLNELELTFKTFDDMVEWINKRIG